MSGTQEAGHLGELSPDGHFYWDGQEWKSSLSPDRQYQWDGSAWIPVAETRVPHAPVPSARPNAPTPVDSSGAALVLKGVNGQVYVYPNKVTIKRKGFLAKSTQGFFTGDKDIYVHQIGSINVKQGGVMTNGFIQFAPVGNVERRRGLTEQTHDENTIIIRKSQNDEVARIKRYVEDHMIPNVGPTLASAPPPDKYQQLERLAALRSSGVLSEAEFAAEKTKILGT